MQKDFNEIAYNLINSQSGGMLGKKNAELKKLADSTEGKKLKEIIDRQGVDIAGAIEKGDVNSMKSALANILSTKEGARLAEQLKKMMDENKK
jgi:hypothetical protein